MFYKKSNIVVIAKMQRINLYYRISLLAIWSL